jgi:hypothetical protein
VNANIKAELSPLVPRKLNMTMSRNKPVTRDTSVDEEKTSMFLRFLDILSVYQTGHYAQSQPKFSKRELGISGNVKNAAIH